LTFETPIYVPLNSILIASKLDKENTQTCRLAFHGKIIQVITIEDTVKLKVFTKKEKEGKIERVVTPNEVIAKDLFKKETDMSLFTKLFVYLPNGNKGTIMSAFGKSGKFKVFFSRRNWIYK
jgi:selenocysteine-specific elongation factor